MKSFDDYIKNLLEVLKVPSMSYKEFKMQEYLKAQIPGLKKDKKGNLYLLNPGTPLFSAHMDTVGGTEDQFALPLLDYVKDEDKILGFGNIGADDKVGVHMALELYREYGDKISLTFFVEEEVGCRGSKDLCDNEDIVKHLKRCMWFMVMDRRNGHDFICSSNDYGSKEFEEEAMKHIGESTPFKFVPCAGLMSDAGELCKHLSGANISVGYYEPHTKREYIIGSEAYITYLAMREMVEKMGHIKFKAPEKKIYVGTQSGTDGAKKKLFGKDGKNNMGYEKNSFWADDDDEYYGYGFKVEKVKPKENFKYKSDKKTKQSPYNEKKITELEIRFDELFLNSIDALEKSEAEFARDTTEKNLQKLQLEYEKAKDIKKRLDEIYKQVRSMLGKKDERTKELHESIMQFLCEYKSYGEIYFQRSMKEVIEEEKQLNELAKEL
jgi:hypothetical protein